MTYIPFKSITEEITQDNRWSKFWYFKLGKKQKYSGQYLLTVYKLIPNEDTICIPGARVYEVLLFSIKLNQKINFRKKASQQTCVSVNSPNFGFQFTSNTNEMAKHRIEQILLKVSNGELGTSPNCHDDWLFYFHDGASLTPQNMVIDLLIEAIKTDNIKLNEEQSLIKIGSN